MREPTKTQLVELAAELSDTVLCAMEDGQVITHELVLELLRATADDMGVRLDMNASYVRPLLATAAYYTGHLDPALGEALRERLEQRR